MTIGERIAQQLKEKDMTQREFSRKIGVTEVSMTRYVHDVRMPRLNIVRKMAKALGVTTDYLLGMEDGEGNGE